MKITSAHGGGGKQTGDLIGAIFGVYFTNEILDRMEDAAVLDLPSTRIAFTTDSFVVTPLFFPGGDIGKLAVCGTVNDLLMRGARPKYLSAGFILEEGLDTDDLERVVISMHNAAREAGVLIVAGDTKVVEGKAGMYVNTSGIGMVEARGDISAGAARPGDAVIISGHLGNHQACLLSRRMGIENTIESDCAPLGEMVLRLLESGLDIHTLRDITRGGLATVLNEIAAASKVRITLDGGAEYADEQVRGFCDILGLDPLTMGNEGRLALLLPEKDAERALALIRGSKYGADAIRVGTVRDTDRPEVVITTRAGGTRVVTPLLGEGLPRIC
ncbi:hydrogenase expression/formation protein HypE [Sporobacter termitidis DSM 10068]|uniref:Hydrogenase expression/formation protein HypE n=1 Tax=Sporobacter termitidis DSM 10068 TaxID=1123282 RepID=A0A1M5Z0B7_9FIRM|nr:hydrogenase expression/formation protein HypE [Sporobacter termitidis]SHI17707.1 hydrogenase expression/formation protein HypE [Sporobacter termitidis DSM 10068]